MAAMDEADCLLGARDSALVASLATALALTLYEGLERLLMPALPSLAVLTDGCAPDSAARATRPAVGGSAPERMRVRTPGVQRSWARRSDALSRALICLERIRRQSILGPGARARNSQAQGCMRCPGSEQALPRALSPAQQKQTPGPRNRSPSDLDTSGGLRCVVRVICIWVVVYQASASSVSSSALSWLLTTSTSASRAPLGVGGRSSSRHASSDAASWRTASPWSTCSSRSCAVKLRPLPAWHSAQLSVYHTKLRIVMASCVFLLITFRNAQ